MSVALFGGEGDMPARVLEGMQAAGDRVFFLGLEDLSPEETANRADEVVWMRHPRLGQVIRECQKRGATELTIVGRIPHNRIFSLNPLQMDWTTLRLYCSLRDLRADTVLKALAKTFARKGITLISSIRYLGPYLAKKGVLTAKRPSPAALRDIEFGTPLARELGRLDIGQTIVVKNRSVVAVEGMEGTDHCLQRAFEIAGEGCVVVKMPKPDQDMRFDVPVIGINTIEKLAKMGAAALAIEADRTVLIDPDTLDIANKLGVAIVGISV